MESSIVPVSPFGTKLRGRGEIAAYHLGADTPQTRRISALMSEVRPENRIPYGYDGDGQPFSFTGWLDEYAVSRRKNPVT
jgi:hypothetical protein